MKLIDRPSNYVFGVQGSSLDISCRWSDPSLETILLQGDKERVPDEKKISKSGQVFTIHNLEATDKGKYYCKSSGNTAYFGKLVHVFPHHGKCMQVYMLAFSPKNIYLRMEA